MIYIYYSKKEPWIGWMVKNTKWTFSDYCGKSFGFAIRTYLWYLGVPPQIAFNLFRSKQNGTRGRKGNKKSG